MHNILSFEYACSITAGRLTREQACSGNEIVKNKDEKRKFGFERVEAFTSSTVLPF
jgi:hypothetical protein